MHEDLIRLREASERLCFDGEAGMMVQALFGLLEQQRVDAEQQRVDAEQARQRCDEAEVRSQQAEARLEEVEQRCAFALDTIKALHQLLFGRKSEKLSDADLRQLRLDLGGEADALTVPTPSSEGVQEAERPATEGKKKRKHPGRTKLASHLERVIEDVPVPEGERICQCCGKEMHRIGHVEHERVEHIPAKLVVHIERRETRSVRSAA